MSADLEDFISLDEVAENVTLPDQWPGLIRAIKSLGALFDGKVTTGTEPQDILNGLILGDLLGTQRRNWRIATDATGNLLFQRNTGLQDTPTWTTRLTIDPSTGLGNFAPLVHQHAAADVVSGTFADARISQSSVDQWGVSVPAASRIVKAKSDGDIDEGWIPQVGVDQWAVASGGGGSANRVAKLNGSGVWPDSMISQSSVLQHAAFYKLQGFTVTGGQNIDFVGLSASGIAGFQIRGWASSGTASFLNMFTDFDNGSSFDSGVGVYDGNYAYLIAGGSGWTNGLGASTSILVSPTNFTAGGTVEFIIDFNTLGFSTASFSCRATSVYTESGTGTNVLSLTYSKRVSAGVVNAIRLQLSNSGNMAATLYGLRA